MRSAGGNRFVRPGGFAPSQSGPSPASPGEMARPAGLGEGPVAAPAALPTQHAVPAPVRISAEELARFRDVLQGQGYLPVKGTDSFFTRLPPVTVQHFYRTFYTATATVPGTRAVRRLGGFQVPANMIAVVLSMNFAASFVSGGVQVAVPQGTLLPNLSFAAYVNGHQLGSFAGADLAPAGTATYGEYAPDQQVVPVEPTIQMLGTGPGMLEAPNQAFFVPPSQQIAFAMTVEAAAAVAITGGSVVVGGFLAAVRDLYQAIGTGIV